MKRLLVVMAALLLAAVVAALLAPATLLDRWVRDASRGRIGLASAEGTLWNGDADVALTLPNGRVVAVPGIRWKVSPWSLLGGAIEGEIRSADNSRGATGKFRVERDVTELTDLSLALPADVLAGAALIATLAPAGTISVDIGSLRWAPPASRGGGTLRWRDAAVSLPDLRAPLELGTVHASFEARGDRFAFTVKNEGGSVYLEGEGEWQPGATPTIAARVDPTAATPPHVASLLQRLASSGASGSLPLRYPPAGASPLSR